MLCYSGMTYPEQQTAWITNMAEKFWTVTEVIRRFEIDGDFLRNLEEEEIICPVCRENASDKLLSREDVENLRLAKILSEEMDVNLPGIEVILQMRKNMLEMRNQFDAILEDLAKYLQERLKHRL
ncbi:MAG: hypothetical protein DRH37_07530 [Deltaproteobacteria bacterium]|nr:MAG: hypothetical protein DRH37_07530 [Deltaproteobacteria bacterium]